MNRRGRLCQTTLAAAFACLAVAARAEPRVDTDEEALEKPSLEELVVTATRREVGVQSVPMSVRALSQSQLEEIGAVDFYDYARLVPGLDYGTVGPGESRIIIRGVASNTGVSTVGLYLDDLPVQSQGRNPESNLFDVERVEILRGPQGTLYGEGAMGGAIRVITNKADPGAFDAAAESSLLTTRNGGTGYALNGMLNLPLASDRLALRLVGMYRDEDGYIDNVAIDQRRVNTEETRGGRASLRWLAGADSTLTAHVSYHRLETGGLFAVSPGLDDLQQARPVAEPLKDEYTQYGLTFEQALAGADLTVVSSYFDRDATLVRSVGGMARMEADPEDRIFAQEIRLVSTAEGAAQWIAGVFYKNARYSQSARVIDPTFPDFLGGPVLVEDQSTSRAKHWAVFGEYSYRFADRLEATVGLRLFREELSGRGEASGAPMLFPGGPVQTVNEGSDNVVTPKFALAYDLSDDSLIYVIAAKGYRQGGFNPPAELTGGAPETYSPDEIWNYELGAKSAWLDNRLILNGALYYIDWPNLQSVPFFREFEFRYVDNVGKAHSKGIELELIARPVEGLELNAGGNLTVAKLDEDTDGAPAGVRLPRVPRSNFALSVAYRWHIARGLQASARAGWQHVGKSYSQLDNDPLSLAPSYRTTDLRIGLEGERWSVHAWARNLFDERAVTQSDLLASGTLAINQPRTVGVTLRTRL